jgi:carotenoid cleavage dioxygenase
MIHRFELADQQVAHLGQYVHTAKYLAEAAAGHFLFNAFGTYLPGSNPVPDNIDQSNSANINVVHFGGELLALWEAGSAYRLDPESLQTLGPKVWNEATVGKPFSAHPRVEPDGTLWNFGVDPLKDELTIYHVGPDGQLLRTHTIHVEQLPPTHDFAVTERHLVFLLPPLILNRDRLESGSSFAEACKWTPSLGMRVLLVDKSDWSQQTFELPAGCLFHVANAWEDTQRVIRLHYMRAADPMSLLAGWSVMAGEYQHFEGARLTSVTIDPSRRTAEQQTIGARESEFPAIEPRGVARRTRQVLCLERSTTRPNDLPGFDEIALVDLEDGTSQTFSYGTDWLVEEHVFAGDGIDKRSRWILGTALDLTVKQTVLSVFDGDRIAEGPIARARLPYALPLGLHGSFRPAAA